MALRGRVTQVDLQVSFRLNGYLYQALNSLICLSTVYKITVRMKPAIDTMTLMQLCCDRIEKKLQEKILKKRTKKFLKKRK